MNAAAKQVGSEQGVAKQPFIAMSRRAVKTLTRSGRPLPVELTRRIDASAGGSESAVAEISDALAALVIADVELDHQGYARVTKGEAELTLIESGWRSFLVRVTNPHHLKGRLLVSTTAGWGFRNSSLTPGTMSSTMNFARQAWSMDRHSTAGLVEKMWLLAQIDDEDRPLSGLAIEYRIVHLYARDSGTQRAFLGFSGVDRTRAVFDGRQGFWVEFAVAPSFDVPLSIKDHNGAGCVASLIIRDEVGRVYPAQAMRLAPDMRFHPQIYRGDGEQVSLPEGRYSIRAWRGPEYKPYFTEVAVSDKKTESIEVKLERWIDPVAHGWYPGETHIHAAGCSHYDIPTEGVGPATMIRQVRGEGLAIANVLTWGPGFDHQKHFFSGTTISPKAELEEPELQRANGVRWTAQETESDSHSAIRYDLEVSGFPSSHAGHPVLVGLRDQEFPGADDIRQWPSWNLPIMKWAKAQGAIAGYGHIGIGLAVDSSDLPNYEIPEFYGNGLNEAIVDVAHGAVDFLSGCESHPTLELNGWYHLLNSGQRVMMVGETDYPCISDERPGLGRTYVKCDRPPTDEPGFREWIDGVQAGRSYFGDGRSHILSFRVEENAMGAGDIELPGASQVKVTAVVSALLDEQPDHLIAGTVPFGPSAWHLERARITDSRDVTVELVMNGEVIDSARITANGDLQSIDFLTKVTTSSWLALRILPSVHSSPIMVKVGGRPVAASARSAQWCLDSVDAVWAAKSSFVRPSELDAAHAAFEFARNVYRTALIEADGADA